MTEPAFLCTVLGKPQPAGSKRGFVNPRTGGVIITDANKHAKSWQADVRLKAQELIDAPLLGPLSLRIDFHLLRPKGHYGTGANADRLKPSAPKFPIVKPDTTKLVRAVEDALTGTVWRDDAQVVMQTACKHYGYPERCVIAVYAVL